ncbi:D-xylose ABC transporter ATP-binding protein, partial [Rhizobium ruizarguesonis]
DDLLLVAAGKGPDGLMDLPELMGICHRIIVFSDGKISGEIVREKFDESRILSLAYKEYSRVRQH